MTRARQTTTHINEDIMGIVDHLVGFQENLTGNALGKDHDMPRGLQKQGRAGVNVLATDPSAGLRFFPR
jgi:hypothetical protein